MSNQPEFNQTGPTILRELSDLHDRYGWTDDELQSLKGLLFQFSDFDKLEHLRILKSCPKNFHYTTSRSRPWICSVLDYMEGRREQRNITAQTHMLSQKTFHITQRMREEG